MHFHNITCQHKLIKKFLINAMEFNTIMLSYNVEIFKQYN